MKGMVIDGDDLPEELKQALLGAVKGGHPGFRPARLADLQSLFRGSFQAKFEIGDKVTLREHATNSYKWPKGDAVCIVTQVLDTPARSGNHGSPSMAQRNDLALAFVDESDGELVEFLHDSRNFQKVGSIYDPITLPDGEVLPTI